MFRFAIGVGMETVGTANLDGTTTTKLSTVDFFSAETSYVERICRWAAMEFSIFIPPPKKAE